MIYLSPYHSEMNWFRKCSPRKNNCNMIRIIVERNGEHQQLKATPQQLSRKSTEYGRHLSPPAQARVGFRDYLGTKKPLKQNLCNRPLPLSHLLSTSSLALRFGFGLVCHSHLEQVLTFLLHPKNEPLSIPPLRRLEQIHPSRGPHKFCSAAESTSVFDADYTTTP